MNRQHDPYSPPADATRDKPVLPTDGIWRQGKLLLVAFSAELPTQWCFKTNQPTTSTTRQRYFRLFPLRWGAITLGLNERLLRNRKWRQYLGLCCLVPLVLIAIVMIVSGLVGSDIETIEAMTKVLFGANKQAVYILVFAIFSTVLTMTALIVGSFILSMINLLQFSVKKVTSTHVALRGGHADFLARFPDWPVA